MGRCYAQGFCSRLGTLDHIPPISQGTDTSWAAHLYAEGERDTMLDREHWGGWKGYVK